MIKEIGEAALLGVMYGIGPCTISCAPLVVPLIMSTAKDRKQGVIYSLIFGMGRIFSYVVLGILAGLLGYALTGIVSRVALGIFLVILGIVLFFKVQERCILKSKMKINSPSLSFVAGAIYGMTPCAPLVALLGLAVISGSALVGGMMAFVFGVGTLISPIIVLGFFSGWFARNKEMQEVVHYVSGIFLILMGVLYIFTK